MPYFTALVVKKDKGNVTVKVARMAMSPRPCSREGWIAYARVDCKNPSTRDTGTISSYAKEGDTIIVNVSNDQKDKRLTFTTKEKTETFQVTMKEGKPTLSLIKKPTPTPSES